MHSNQHASPCLTRPLRGSAMLLAAAFAVLLWPGVDASHASSSTHREAARVAGVENLNELMRLRITNVKSKKVTAVGVASGSISGSVSVYLLLSSASHAQAEFDGRNSHGTLRGFGTASYHVAGSMSYFSGTAQSVTGSGRYAHAQSLGIQFNGTMNRRTYEVTMRLYGKWHV